MARVPGSSSSSKGSTAAKTASASKSAKSIAAKKSSKTAAIKKPKARKRIASPTVVNQESLKVKIPHTDEGKLFLAKLQDLLRTTKLPFTRVCSPGQTPTGARTTGSSADDGSTYALDMRLEQEGWP